MTEEKTVDEKPKQPIADRFMEIPVDRIIFDKHNPRREKASKEQDDLLTQHLEVYPQIREPLIVERTSTDFAGSYVLIDGERRLRSAIRAGLRTVPCEVYEELEDDDERNMLRSIKNFMKQPWSEYDQMEFIVKVYQQWRIKHPRSKGKDDTMQASFCQKFGVSEGHLKNCLMVYENPTAKAKVAQGWKVAEAKTLIVSVEKIVGADATKEEKKKQAERVAAKVVDRAEMYDTTWPKRQRVSMKRVGRQQQKKKVHGTRAPRSQSVEKARKTVRAEVQPDENAQDSIALKNILGWFQDMQQFHLPMRQNIMLLRRGDSIAQVRQKIESEIRVFQDLLKDLRARTPGAAKTGGSF